MEISGDVRTVCDQIVQKFSPVAVILFSMKRTLSGEVASFKLCVVADTADRRETERRIYLEVDSLEPYDVLVYTPQEWEKHTSEHHSFAHSIQEKGTVLYGKAS